LFFERVGDWEEGVCVGVREGVVDVVLKVVRARNDGIGVECGTYSDQFLEDWLKVFDGAIVEWID
jgi:hypothetical protein